MTFIVIALGYVLIITGFWGSVHSLLYARGVVRDPDTDRQSRALLLGRLGIGVGLVVLGYWLALSRAPHVEEILVFAILGWLYYKWYSLKHDVDYLWGKHWGRCRAEAVAEGDEASVAALDTAHRAHFARPVWRNPVTGKSTHVYPALAGDGSEDWIAWTGVLAPECLTRWEAELDMLGATMADVEATDRAVLEQSLPAIAAKWEALHANINEVLLERWVALTPQVQVQTFLTCQTLAAERAAQQGTRADEQ